MNNTSPIPLACSTWDNEELQELQKVIESGIYTMGPKVKEFENKFSEYHQSKFCVMVNSGSSANFLMIAALFFKKNGKNLKPGDEIIVPAVSWSTTYSPLYYLGLKMRFVDINIDTLNIDVDLIEKAITKNTKAIFAVNLLGNSADYKKLFEICEKQNLLLLEDNCESLGAKNMNKLTGTFGDVSSCSSFFSHHISTMEGGLILTNDEEIYHILLSIRAHGWTRELPTKNLISEKSRNSFFEAFRFVLPGFNMRPLEMSGALGSVQIQKLDFMIAQRRKNYFKFKEVIEEFDVIKTQKETGISSWFGFSLIIDEKSNLSRNELIKILKSKRIDSRPIVCGNILKNEMVQYFNYSIYGNLISADIVHNQGLFIGNHHIDITNGLNNLSNALRQFCK